MSIENSGEYHARPFVLCHGWQQRVAKEAAARRNLPLVLQRYHFRDQVIALPGLTEHWAPSDPAAVAAVARRKKEEERPLSRRLQIRPKDHPVLALGYDVPRESTSAACFSKDAVEERPFSAALPSTSPNVIFHKEKKLPSPPAQQHRGGAPPPSAGELRSLAASIYGLPAPPSAASPVAASSPGGFPGCEPGTPPTSRGTVPRGLEKGPTSAPLESRMSRLESLIREEREDQKKLRQELDQLTSIITDVIVADPSPSSSGSAARRRPPQTLVSGSKVRVRRQLPIPAPLVS